MIGKQSRKQVQAVRKQVFERDGHVCVVANTTQAHFHPCWGDLTIQHRVGRGMGGSALYDSPEYLVTMCLGHNLLIESDPTFALYCRMRGLSVPRWLAAQFNVSQIPVRTGDGWFMLSSDGRRHSVASITAETVLEEIYYRD